MVESFRHSWASIDKLRVGRWGEQFVAMALTQRGFDTYVPAVDDRSVDLLVRAAVGTHRFIELQVKTMRLDRWAYVFMRKRYFTPHADRYLSLVLLTEHEPDPSIYFIPSLVWQQPNLTFVSRDYEGKQSEPEYGINIARKRLDLLEPFRLSAGKPIAF